jgi:hypothetical protein
VGLARADVRIRPSLKEVTAQLGICKHRPCSTLFEEVWNKPARHPNRSRILPLRSAVEQTDDAAAPTVQHVRIDHRCLRYRQVGQKLLDFRRAELRRVPLAVEMDEAFNPVDVGLLGS